MYQLLAGLLLVCDDSWAVILCFCFLFFLVSGFLLIDYRFSSRFDHKEAQMLSPFDQLIEARPIII